MYLLFVLQAAFLPTLYVESEEEGGGRGGVGGGGAALKVCIPNYF